MPSRAIYLLAVEGYADWEPSHALAELRRHGGYRVETVGLTRQPVTSMGGIRVMPTRAIGEVDPDDVEVLILPGGDRWESPELEPEIEALVRDLDNRAATIAAICGATIAIARLGLLKGRLHTSNGLDYLRTHVAGYNEDANYVDTPAVRDRGLLTASGLGDVEFARELFEDLGVLSPDDRAAWAQIFRTARLPR